MMVLADKIHNEQMCFSITALPIDGIYLVGIHTEYSDGMCSLVWSPVLFHFCFISPFSFQVLELAPGLSCFVYVIFCKIVHVHVARSHRNTRFIHTPYHHTYFLLISLLSLALLLDNLTARQLHSQQGTECGKWEMRNGKFSHFSFPIFTQLLIIPFSFPIFTQLLIIPFSFPISQ